MRACTCVHINVGMCGGAAGLTLAKVCGAAELKQAEDICMGLGQYFQIQVCLPASSSRFLSAPLPPAPLSLPLTHARARAHTDTHTQTHTHAHAHTNTHARTHARMHARTHARTHMRTDTSAST